MSAPLFPPRILECLQPPPEEGESLERLAEGFRVFPGGGIHPDLEGVPSLFWPDRDAGEAGVTQRVQAFYEENPFPNYEGLEEFGDLVTKGHANPFSRRLLEAIGMGRTVLECGCGTGQLSHYLQLNNNHVLGVDMSLASLKLALAFKEKNQLGRAAFCRMNLFNLALRDQAFDVVISQGVLHHTHDARRAFANIVRKVRIGGLVVVGLYNRPARLPTWLRGRVIGLLGPRLDYVVRTRIRDPEKARIWIQDQYHNPRETWHSVDEVLGWFAENRVRYLNCSPPILGSDGEETGQLAAATSPGTRYQRWVTQLGWLGSIAREGALFTLVGRREG